MAAVGTPATVPGRRFGSVRAGPPRPAWARAGGVGPAGIAVPADRLMWGAAVYARRKIRQVSS